MRVLSSIRLPLLCAMAAIVLCASPAASAATTVKKDISDDTVWRAKKSPYVVKENIMLEEGVTLEIERGVRVEFAPGISLQIRGKFLALGAPDKPIVFTAQSDEPWGNLYFTDFSDDAEVDESGRYVDGCVMKHCIVEKGRGIYIRFGSPLIAECNIRDNLSSGIRVEYGGPRIVRNHIWGNSTQSESASGNGGGIIAYTNRETYIADNIVSNNISDGGRDGGGGIYVYAVEDATIVVKNNVLFGNTSDRFAGGIYSYGATLSNNTVINNKAAERGGGIYAVESKLTGNLVQSNTSERGGGVYAESCDLASNSIIRNVALRPEGGGLYYFGSGAITDNCFVSNTAAETDGCGGIYVSGNPEIRSNNLFNNSGYALYVANVADAPEVSAAGNFWGATFERAILDLTFDWLDDATTGLANYIPYLEAMSAATPPPPPFNLTAVAVEDGIRISWDETAGSKSGGHMIYFGTDGGYPYEKVVKIGPENKSLIEELTPGVEYYVAVSSFHDTSDREVESGLSEELRVLFTGSDESLGAPRNLSPQNDEAETSNKALLKAGEPDAGARVTASRWQVSTSSDDFSALAIDRLVAGDGLSALNIEAGELAGGQKYHWRVAYQSDRGSWSDWSEPTSFTTRADAPSILSGPISVARKLEKRHSPYLMSGNTLITPDGALEVEAGVEVRVAPGKNLMVRGSLVARGTASEPITFTKGSSDNWGRIIFAKESADFIRDDDGGYKDGCILERCVIEQGEGLLVESSSPLIKDCVIADNNGSGITVRRGGPVITGNEIRNNSARTNGGGIYAYTNDIIFVLSNNIHDNRADGDGGGVYAYGYMNTSTIRIEDNDIAANNATGDGGGIYLSRSSAVGNRIESNAAGGGGGGIFATFGLIDSNKVRDNRADKGGGIYAERNSSLTSNYITSNSALSGFGGGVYINFWGTSIDNESFTKNTVTENLAPEGGDNGGVYIVGYLSFERNNIHGNAGSQLYNGNEPEDYALVVPRCYWGTGDKSAISKLIVDADDDPNLGKVTFEPFSSSPLRFD